MGRPKPRGSLPGSQELGCFPLPSSATWPGFFSLIGPGPALPNVAIRDTPSQRRRRAGGRGAFSPVPPTPKDPGGIAEGAPPLVSERLRGDPGQSGRDLQSREGEGGAGLNCCARKAGPVDPKLRL